MKAQRRGGVLIIAIGLMGLAGLVTGVSLAPLGEGLPISYPIARALLVLALFGTGALTLWRLR